MIGIDLHTHSTASDGTTSPADLVREAREAGLSVVALTDHDTTAGHAEAAAALPPGLTLVRGAEISCRSGSTSLHLLAYLFDPLEPVFAAARAELRRSRVGRAERMVARLVEDGAAISWEQVSGLADGTVGRPHVAQALVDAGLVGSVTEAFAPQWLGERYDEVKLELDAVEAVRLVTGAGGVAVFAHLAAETRGPTVGDEVVAAMAAAGLAGLELDHPDHDAAGRARVAGLAADLGLLTTGSSDFHGTRKPVRLGAHRTSPEALEALVASATGAEVLVG